MWRKCPRSAQGTGSDQKEPMPLARQGFLHPWILRIPVTLSVRAEVVVSSPMILGMLEHLRVKLLLDVVGYSFLSNFYPLDLLLLSYCSRTSMAEVSGI